MKKILFPALLILMLSTSPARAWVASEGTQIMNNIQLVLQYAKQVQQYKTQLQQYQTALKHLEQNPSGSFDNGLNLVIDGVGTVMSAQNAIGGAMEKIDSEISKKYGNEMMGSFAEKFKTWTDTSNATLGGAMRAAGLHRDAYASEAQALKALYLASQSSTGTVAAVQQLGALTAMQIQQSQKLGDLLATQNIATSTWMASQTSKEQAQADVTTKVMQMDKPGPAPNPAQYKGKF